MIRDFHRKWAISRRNFLQSAAGAAALASLGLPPGLARAAEGPWSERPGSDVDQLNFVVWTTNIEILSARDGIFEVAACYTVYQTDLEGQTRLFSVGQYRDVIANGAGELRFREKIAVCDTFNIPNLLAIPL